MYKGKYSNRKKRRLAPWAALALALVLTLSVGGTIAYLITDTRPVTNTFTPGNIACAVVESGWKDGNTTKKDVTIQNTGNTDAYIRAAIVVNWIDTNGHFAPEAVSNNEYSLDLGNGWIEQGGYYYWPSSVAASAETGKLIQSCSPNVTKEGYTLCVEVLADAIQATPIKAVKDAWGIDPTTLLGSN